MKNSLILFLIVGLIFTLTGINFPSDENDITGGKSGVLVLKVSASTSAIATIGASIWGGIFISKKIMGKEKKKIVMAILNEATTGYGNRIIIAILAKYYCCSIEEVIDTISALSMKGNIDVNGSLIDEQIASKSLDELEGELFAIALKNENIKKKINTAIGNLITHNI